MAILPRLGALAAVLFLIPSLEAQTAKATVLADVNAQPSATFLGSNPYHGRYVNHYAEQRFLKLGGKAFFRAYTQKNGTELWESGGDTKTTRMVADIRPGLAGSYPNYLTIAGSKLFFSANDGSKGTELWVKDGLGTRLVKDVRAGSLSSYVAYIAAIGSKVVFYAYEPATGYELYISDGTAAGTKLVKDIYPGAGSSYPRYMRTDNSGKRVYFRARDNKNGYELWVTDGTALGTRMVKDLRSGAGVGSNPYRFVPAGNKMYFVANDGKTGEEIYVSDGTSAGTMLLKDVWPGTTSGSYLYYSVALGNKLLFRGRQSATGYEAWVTDGTPAGTKLLQDTYAGANSGYFNYPEQIGGKVYFQANDGKRGYELWESDGTSAGTKLFMDVYRGSSSGYPRNLTRTANGKWYCLGYQLYSGGELLELDPVTHRARLVMDIQGGDGSSTPSYITEVLPNKLVFSAAEPVMGRELWFSDGSFQGTHGLDINKPVGKPTSTTGSAAWYASRFGTGLVFQANDGLHGQEPWISDTTTKGTRLLKDVQRGIDGFSGAYGQELSGRYFFRGFTDNEGYELWVSDGTATGTRLFMDIYGGSSSGNPSYLQRIGDKIWFAAAGGPDEYKGSEPWVTDGTIAGTHRVADVRVGTSSASPRYFAGEGGRVLFWAYDGATSKDHGYELWISDGTEKGTRMLKDIRTGPLSSYPAYMTAYKGKVLFRAYQPATGYELWISDYTTAGTRLLKDIAPGSTSSYASYFEVFQGKVWFRAWQPGKGYELWSSDGTRAGTKLAMDLATGTSSSYPGYLTSVGKRHLYFSAYTSSQGYELYKSDGTLLGTRRVTDIYSGGSSSSPSNQDGDRLRMAVARGKVFFRATSPVTGTEIYGYPNGATASSITSGCSTSLLTTNADPVLGKAMTLTLTHTIPGAVSSFLLLGGAADRPSRVGTACANYLDFGGPVFLIAASSKSSFSLPVPIPSDPFMIGSTFVLQAWQLTPAFPKAGGLHLSNAIEISPGL